MAVDKTKIEDMLNKCDLHELEDIEKTLISMLDMLRGAVDVTSDLFAENTSEERQEKRFNTDILATVFRKTEVRPGQRLEFCGTIKNISRQGMCLQISSSFIPSRMIEVLFSVSGGKSKRCYMEVVRMRKAKSPKANWIELGCQSIDNARINDLMTQEHNISEMRKILTNRGNIVILAVSSHSKSRDKNITDQIKKYDFYVRTLHEYSQVIRSASMSHAHLAIFYEGSRLKNEKKFFRELKSKPSDLATMAIIEDEQDRTPLLRAGIDECLHIDAVDKYLLQAIERAMLGCASRKNKQKTTRSSQALVVNNVNGRNNILSFHMNENGYNLLFADNLDEAQNHSIEDIDLVLADFEPADPENFENVRELFFGLPVVALCEDIADGQQALLHGGSDYLCMPPTREDINMILERASSS